ncbi:MAG: hypothetical protein R3C56_41780 [Pirellulaceae bacterium]
MALLNSQVERRLPVIIGCALCDQKLHDVRVTINYSGSKGKVASSSRGVHVGPL